MKLIESINQDI